MIIDISMHGCWILVILWQPKLFWKEHERARYLVINIAVPLPVFSVFVILRVVVRSWPMNMPQNLVEQMAD